MIFAVLVELYHDIVPTMSFKLVSIFTFIEEMSKCLLSFNYMSSPVMTTRATTPYKLRLYSS